MLIYLKSRDAVSQSIVNIDDLGNEFVIHRASGDTLFLMRSELSDIGEILEKVKGQTGLVVLNTKRNVDFVIANWVEFAKCEKLCIYFVNPVSNEKWLLYPHTHDQITEKVALRRGLEALFAEVAPYA